MSPAHLSIDRTRRVSLTLGAAIAVGSFLAGAGATWGTMRSDLAAVIKKNDEQDRKIEPLVERLSSIEGKLDMLIRRNP